MSVPMSFEEALRRASDLLTDDEIALLREKTLFRAMIELHLTFGHRVRNNLELWSDGAIALFEDMTKKQPQHIALDADSASGALVAALWYKFHPEAHGQPQQGYK